MSKYIYLGKYEKLLLFYNESKDEFYATEEGYFDIEIDNDFEILDEFSSPDQEAKERAVRITNPDEIKALKSAYICVKAYEKKERALQKGIKNMNKKVREEALKKERRTKQGFLFVMTLITLMTFHSQIHASIKNLGTKIENTIDDYHATNRHDEEHLNSLLESIEANSTMSDELREKFNSLFLQLVATDIYMYDYQVNAICRRLKKFNFSEYNENNYSNTLSFILFGNENTFNKYVSLALDEYANKREPSEESIMFGMLNSIESNSNLISEIFNNEKSYIRSLAKKYNTTEDNIRDLLNLINLYSEIKDPKIKEETKKSFYNKLGILLLEYYRDKKEYCDIDKIILSSQIFDGEFIINNNLFANNIIVSYNDPKYGKYNLYYDNQTGEDISYYIYYRKLADLIESKKTGLDYDDSDSRLLIYLLTLSYNSSYSFELDEFKNCEKSDELAKKLYKDIFLNINKRVEIDPAFIYAYFCNGTINISDVISEIKTPNADAFSIALFKEFDQCMRIELANDNISYEEYNDKLAKILESLKKTNEDLYQLLYESIINDTSFFSELNISPFSYTLKNGDIKKYIYVPK